MEQARSMHAVNNAAKLPPHLGAPMVITALAVGVVADLLLRVTPWGLNVTLVAGLVVLAGWGLTRWGGVALEGEGRWLTAPCLFFACALTWRDSPTLNVANALALVVAGTLAALTSRAADRRDWLGCRSTRWASRTSSGTPWQVSCRRCEAKSSGVAAAGGGGPIRPWLPGVVCCVRCHRLCCLAVCSWLPTRVSKSWFATCLLSIRRTSSCT
jgi:hypothetical protein